MAPRVAPRWSPPVAFSDTEPAPISEGKLGGLSPADVVWLHKSPGSSTLKLTPPPEPHRLGASQWLVASDGAIFTGGRATTLTGEAQALLAFCLGAGTNAFADLHEATELQAVARYLSSVSGRLKGPTLSPSTTALRQQGVSACASLLLDVAVRLRSLKADGPAAAVESKYLALVATLGEAERRFYLSRYLRLGAPLGMSQLTQVRAELYPLQPPYAAWLKDGVVRVAMTIDGDGTSLQSAESMLKDMGFVGGSAGWRREGPPRIEVNLRVANSPDADVFAGAADPKNDIVIYSGHAGYGRIADHKGTGKTSSNKDQLILQLSCSGDSTFGRISARLGAAQVLSTTQATSDASDRILLAAFFDGIASKQSWKTLREKVSAKLAAANDPGASARYFYPDESAIPDAHLDGDGDGLLDVNDRVFLPHAPMQPDNAWGLNPVQQPCPDYLLDGSGLVSAVETCGLCLRYDHVLPPSSEVKAGWAPERLRADGFFTPEPGNDRFFSLSLGADGVTIVRLSRKYAHTSSPVLARLLALQLGQHLGARAGLNTAGQVALSVLLYGRMVHQQDNRLPRDPDPTMIALLEWQRFGLAGSLTALELAASPEEVDASTYAKVLAALPAEAAYLAPGPVLGQALVITQKPVLYPRGPAATLQASLRQAGLAKWRVVSSNYHLRDDHTALVWAVDPLGAVHLLGVRADPDSRVLTQVSDLGSAPDAYVHAKIEAFWARACAVAGVDRKWFDLHMEKKSPGGIRARLQYLRARVPLGSDLSPLPPIEVRVALGVESEFNALFPLTPEATELTVVQWFSAYVPNVETQYRKAVADLQKSGRSRTLEAAVAAIPLTTSRTALLELVTTCARVSALTNDAEGLASLMRAISVRFKLSRYALARAACVVYLVPGGSPTLLATANARLDGLFEQAEKQGKSVAWTQACAFELVEHLSPTELYVDYGLSWLELLE